MKSAFAGIVCVLALVSCGDDPNSLDGQGSRSSSASSSSGSSSSGASSGSSGTSSGEPTSSGVVGTGATINELCWSTINEYRKRDGLAPLARWTEIETCADGEAESDAKTGRAHGAFPKCGELAQNECPGTPGPVEQALPRCLKAMWDEGPGGGHHDNMATTKYKKVACGVFVTSRGALWCVQNFR